MDEPIDLSQCGYTKGYYLYRDGRIWSERAALRGKPHFITADKTGSVLLQSSNGKYVRRSGKLMAFQLYTVPDLLEAGFVPVYGGAGYVDKYGEVYGSNRGERLTPMPNRQYLSVHLAGKTRPLHRVVAEAFIPNPDNKPEVDHIDGNKHNNNADNLRWVTRSENMKAAYLNGALDDSLRKARLSRLKK